VAPRTGRLTHANGPQPTVGLEDPVVVALAEKYGKTGAQIVLRWHLDHGWSAIPKSVKPHRIAENFDVFDSTLTSNEIASIDALDTGVRGGLDPTDSTSRTTAGSSPTEVSSGRLRCVPVISSRL
jgi:diketogulonate reductase-like aldo/keto reductase